MTTETRKAIRSVLSAIVILAVLGLLFWQTYLIQLLPFQVAGLARLLIGILALNEIMNGAENVTRAFKFTGPLGLGADFGADAPAAAQAVADSAQDAADIVKAAP